MGRLLTAAERDAIRRLHDGICMEPTRGAEGRYDLTADQTIGLVCVPGLVIEIRAKVPMSSVLSWCPMPAMPPRGSPRQPELARDNELTERLAMMLARLVGMPPGADS
jgi:hypothetical protein